MCEHPDRRTFLKTMAIGAGVTAGAGVGWPGISPSVMAGPVVTPQSVRPPYRGPNVILVRFGGGVRRRETIDPEHTYSAYLRHELTKRGTLFTNMEIDQIEGVNTSHGEGTLNLLTGIYDTYADVEGKFLGARFEAKVPTLFEYLRKAYDIPPHQTLLINGEDRTDEEFYTFSNHHLFGVKYRSHVLSLYRFKVYLLRRQIELGRFKGAQMEAKTKELAELEALDYRQTDREGQGDAIEGFWEAWRQYYGETGLVNPRGDRLLTELAIRAIKTLRPKLMMINYQDPDYVHWGYLSHYTRGIAVIDQGIQRLVATVEADEAYRDNTVFVVVPDCGRDSNRCMAVPCQHHFNSKSSHELWAMLFGPGIAAGQVVDKPVSQIATAATIGKIMGFDASFAQGEVLAEAMA